MHHCCLFPTGLSLLVLLRSQPLLSQYVSLSRPLVSCFNVPAFFLNMLLISFVSHSHPHTHMASFPHWVLMHHGSVIELSLYLFLAFKLGSHCFLYQTFLYKVHGHCPHMFVWHSGANPDIYTIIIIRKIHQSLDEYWTYNSQIFYTPNHVQPPSSHCSHLHCFTPSCTLLPLAVGWPHLFSLPMLSKWVVCLTLIFPPFCRWVSDLILGSAIVGNWVWGPHPLCI